MLSNIIGTIGSILDNYQNSSGVIELEAKFGFYTNKFNSNVPYIHYDRLLNKLRNIDSIVEISETSNVAQHDNIRRITTVKLGDQPETILWQTKNRIRDFDIYDYDMRISINLEQEISAQPIFTPKIIRERSRHTFSLYNGLIKIDMTEVIMRDEDKTIKPKYEVEVEYTGNRNNLDLFQQEIENIFKLLRGTNIVFTSNEKKRVTDDFTNILGGSKEILVEARNIKKKDLVFGGIVGNQNVRDERVLAQPRRSEVPRGTNYIVTIKADGLRKLLIIHSTGVWLIHPPFEYNLVLNTKILPKLSSLLNSLNGSIFDGELVELKRYNGVLFNYLIFDCLSFKGDRRIQDQTYISRQKIIEAVAKVIKTPVLTVNVKESQEVTVDNFFSTVKYFLDRRTSLEYNEDGLMFTPIDIIYNPMSQKYPLRERSLTSVPDICKWKKPEDITIDFSIKPVLNGKIELYSFDSIKGKSVLFTGSQMNPLTPDMIDHDNPLTKNVPANLIVEYEFKNGLMSPRRIRYDKSGANKLLIALDNWEDIMNPIGEKDLIGETLMMSRSYGNRIKRNLYNSLITTDTLVNILDIGSGRGGDVDKWKRLKGFIVAVEPNVSNRTELIRRIEINDMNNRVFVVPTGGEDTVTITNIVKQNIPDGKVDVITMMLSLSFFWSSSSHLDALTNTIINNLKPGGKILFYTIDGDSLEQLMRERNTDHISLATANIKLYPKKEGDIGREVDFILPDTIVGEQREYVVKLDELTKRLETYGIFLHKLEKADTEKFLSEDNKIYSALYSFGQYINSDPELLFINSSSPVQNTELSFIDVNISNNTVGSIDKDVDPSIISNSPIDSPIISKELVILDAVTNDDSYCPVICSWFSNLVRIATIGDGNCFIHAALKGFYEPYQNNPDSSFRRNLSSQVRRDLAILLQFENKRYPNNTYWSTSSNGAFPRMLMQQIKDRSLINELGVNFSLRGLQFLLNSTANLGDEIYKYISDIFNIDIYILRGTKDDLFPHYHTKEIGIIRDSIVIIGNKFHYELLAIVTTTGLQTVFKSYDPIMIPLSKLFSDINENFDPNESFIKDFIDTFAPNGLIDFPSEILSEFESQDPFVVKYNELLPIIKQRL